MKTIMYLLKKYAMACPPVHGDNPFVLASGLSYAQVNKHGITNYFIQLISVQTFNIAR